MKTLIRFIPVAFASVCCTFASVAQEWKKDFPEAEAVYTNLSCDLTIKSSNGELTAARTISEDLFLSTDNAAKLMSRGYIYHSSFNELKKWDAYTQVPSENKKFKVANTSVSSSQQDYIFYDDAKTTNFDFAGIRLGATRHMEYELQHKDLHLLMPYYFDRYFPLLNGELKITFPSSVKLKYVVKGIHADKILFKEQKKKDKTIYTFTVYNLPGNQNYPDAPDDSHYATHIVFFIDQVAKDGEWKNYLSTVEDLYKYNYNFIKDINQNISTELKNLTDSLIAGTTNDTEKAKKIYKWVQSNIKYVAFEEGLEGFIPREANLVCSRRFGDCKDMASILTVMLNHAKVPAYCTWIGTRDLPYNYLETPTPIVDNHMICAAKINNQFVFLDGTDNGCIYGMPSSGIQGKEALIAINKSEYKVVKVEVPAKEVNRWIDSTFIELKDKAITGKIKILMSGYFAANMRSALSYRNEKERTKFFENRFNRGSNKISFSDWKIKELNERELVITANFDLPDYAKKMGDEWLMNLNLFKWYEHEEIDFPKRKIPIEYNFLNISTFTTLLKVPASYKVSYLPKSETYKNEVWGFEMKYEQKKGFITLTQRFDTENLLLIPTQFEQWNKVLENLFPHYKQSVVLSKN